jgi:hypothetical protein
MLTFRHTDRPLQFQTIYGILPISSDRFQITRQSSFSSKTAVAEADRAVLLGEMLSHLPGPKGQNDVSGCLYDGELLEITHSDETVTWIALSLPSRASDASWWQDFESFFRQLPKA